MRVGVGFSDNPSSKVAGQEAAQQALERAGRAETCDMVFLFCTARHDQEALREAVAEEVGNRERIYGGGAVGIITNEQFGYAGDQVGVACMWLDGADPQILLDDGIYESEEETGIRLGEQLGKLGVQQDSPVMMFYDAIDRTGGGVRMIMATWLLEGMQKGLGFLPDLTGAGLMGDHITSPTRQYVGDKVGDHYAMAFAFPDDLRIDSTIMHGCRPASGYYTVTKAEGPVILEINGEPAIPFIDKVIEGAIAPEEYPFFLLFGLNNGDRWGEYDENNYASRLCLAIAPEINGIVMFEPDMVPGTEFQLMFRSLDLDYMKPKIEEVFDNLGDREPVFAMYIDCAGRCAGYGGIDMEDAVVLQETVAGRVPLLGLYTGVEIASLGGRPRGLDWTGVFILFSTGKDGSKPEKKVVDTVTWESKDKDESKEISTDALLKLVEQNAAKVLELDTQSIAIRHELEQKRRGFNLLAELSVSLRETTDYGNILYMVTSRINAALNMQKTVVLLPDTQGRFVPVVMQGYTQEEKEKLEGQHIDIDESLLDSETPVLVSGADPESLLADLRSLLGMPYFVSSPVIVRNEVAAILVTGRLMEAPPFLSRLGRTDAETVQAICGLLSTVLIYQKLDAADRQARTDILTGLLNRGAFETEVTDLLFKDKERDLKYAFLMIDFDHFKEVNDTYGHLQGDVALKTLANTLRDNFRATDIVARLGGDEFAVFCPAIGKLEQVIGKAEQLLNTWRDLTLTTEDGRKFKATLSIGIAIAPRDGMSYNELFQKADTALYKSKHEGRDRYTVYDV